MVVQPVRPGNLWKKPAAVQKLRRGGREAGSMSSKIKSPSPCLTCTRVPDPRNCENKNCKRWQKWFLARWALIHAYPRKVMEKAELRPEGVNVGGNLYAPPHRVREYLGTDPCKKCLCPRDLCSSPCRGKLEWEKEKEAWDR